MKKSKKLTKKHVVVRNVLDTEDLKPEHAVDLRASDGMFKHLIVIHTRHSRNPIQVWKRISVETHQVRQQFGATQQIKHQNGNIVSLKKMNRALQRLLMGTLLHFSLLQVAPTMHGGNLICL